MKDADLGDVAGVVPDTDGAADEWCEGGRGVAEAFEVDAVALHDARGWDGEQEPVELFEGVREPWQPPVCDPCLKWARSELAVGAGVVAADERVDGAVDAG